MNDFWSKDQSNITCQGISLKAVFNLMQQMILEVADQINAPSEHARSLLILHKWNKEKVMEAVLNTDQDDLYQKAGIVIPGLDTELLEEGDELTCKICYCDYTEEEMANAGCGHKFCTSCWLNYFRNRIIDESEGESLHCMSENCPQRVSAALVSKICGTEEAKIFFKHQELCAMNFVETTKFLRRCPAADCQYVVQISESESRRCSVTCPCSNQFCFQCYQYSHDPLSCLRLKMWKDIDEDALEGKIKQEEELKQNSVWLKSNAKNCPNCSAPIEKNGGCNHMTCQKCKHEFCWVCMGRWIGHSVCNAYVPPPSEAGHANEEEAKRYLEKYRFHKERYNNHIESMELEKKYRASIRDKLVELQNLEINVTKNDKMMMKDALYVLLRSRLLLAHSYIFAFYVEECSLWNLYLVNQAALETSTEELTAYFQDELVEEDIYSMRKKLPVLTKYCSLRIKAMLDHISEGYEKEIWQFGK